MRHQVDAMKVYIVRYDNPLDHEGHPNVEAVYSNKQAAVDHAAHNRNFDIEEWEVHDTLDSAMKLVVQTEIVSGATQQEALSYAQSVFGTRTQKYIRERLGL